MLLLSQLLFLIVCLGVALVSKARLNQQTQQSSDLLVIVLSAVALAVSMLAQLTLDPLGSDSGTLLRMLNNLAIYAAAPMLVTAVGAITRPYPISRPAWGRWLLGLFALFELCRRMGFGEEYTLVLGICCIAGLAVTLRWLKTSKYATPLLSAVIAFSAALAAHYYHIGLATGLLFSSLGLALLGQAIRNVPLRPQPE